MSYRSLIAAVVGILGLLSSAWAEDLLDVELREAIYRVPVTVTDMYSRTETRPVVITVFRPPGEGKFPLLILNHGRAVEAKRHLQSRQRYSAQARWFVRQGFVVMVPTRIGYGETFGSIDPEYSNSCKSTVLEAKNEALFRQMMAVYDFAKTQDYVDARRWLIAGQSLGGYTTVTVAGKSPPGLVGAINFAGGFGGNPEARRGNPCDAHAWEKQLAQPLPGTPVPMLWVYWHDDWYWGNEVPRQWFKAFQLGGGQGELVQLPALSGDGHAGFSRDFRHWTPVVERFLQQLPVDRPSVALKMPSPQPPATGFARIDEVDKVPYLSASGREKYQEFITGKSPPRAFAINAEGRWGWSSGYEDAHDRALGFCNKNAKRPCALYAIDNDVVWTQ